MLQRKTLTGERTGLGVSRLISRAISLQVSAINPVDAGRLLGAALRVAVAVAASRAWASIAIKFQRRHEVQRRTWCSSSPVRVLVAWKDSSMRQRIRGPFAPAPAE